MDAAVTPLKRSDVAQLRPLERRAILLEVEGMVRDGELTVGDAIRLLRSTMLGMDREAFARAVKLSPRAIAQLEDGDANPTLSTLTRALAPFGAKVAITFARLTPTELPNEDALRRRAGLAATLAKSRRRKRR